MTRLRPVLVVLVAAGLWAQVAYGAEDGFAAIEKQVIEHTLENGLRLILLPRHEVPVFSAVTVANVGSVDEHVGITGLAHMFEHMAFKGTSRIGTTDIDGELKAMARVDAHFLKLKAARQRGASAEELKKLEADFKKARKDAQTYVESEEFAKILERYGVSGLNAGTDFDFTTYYASLPSNKLELWLSLESDRFVDPVLREFYVESDVVKEERFMRYDSNPIGRMLEEFVSMAYMVHPYGQIGIGALSDLETFTRQEAVDFYREYYVPSNLIVALVGDIDPDELLRLAELYFGRLKPGPQPEPIETVEPRQNSERRSTLYGKAQRTVLMGYHKPGTNHPDDAAYEALASILSSGRTSRLYRSLVRDKKLASIAGGFSGFPGDKYPNLFIFYAFPAPGHTNEEILAAMDEQLEGLKNDLVSAEELDRVKAKAKSGMVQALASNQGMATQLAQQEALSGDWRDMFKELDEIGAVTVEDVQRVARETFRKSNRTIVFYEPEEESAKTEEKDGGSTR